MIARLLKSVSIYKSLSIARSLKSVSIQSLMIAGSIFSDLAIVSDHTETRLKKCDTPSITSVICRQNVANWHNKKFIFFLDLKQKIQTVSKYLLLHKSWRMNKFKI